MTDISSFIYKDNERFYFDPENYTGDSTKSLSIKYEDGDMVRWNWEGTKMSGVLREEGYNMNLFVIQKVTIHQ